MYILASCKTGRACSVPPTGFIFRYLGSGGRANQSKQEPIPRSCTTTAFKKITAQLAGFPYFSRYKIPNQEKMYQTNIKCTKLS
jgi:hypothetical protein